MAESGIVISTVQDVTVAALRVASIQDERTIINLANTLYELIDEKAVNRLIVDFKTVSFLSSQMIGVLVTLHKKCKAVGGQVVIVGLRPNLLNIFRITKLDKILAFAKDENDAISKFKWA